MSDETIWLIICIMTGLAGWVGAAVKASEVERLQGRLLELLKECSALKRQIAREQADAARTVAAFTNPIIRRIQKRVGA
jgi:hypothetical protein